MSLARDDGGLDQGGGDVEQRGRWADESAGTGKQAQRQIQQKATERELGAERTLRGHSGLNSLFVQMRKPPSQESELACHHCLSN